jgi:hypothetical protein
MGWLYDVGEYHFNPLNAPQVQQPSNIERTSDPLNFD